MSAPFEALAGRMRAIGAERVADATGRIAEAVRAEVPGVSVEAGDGEVLLSARGLSRRMMTDARLRWIGGLLK